MDGFREKDRYGPRRDSAAAQPAEPSTRPDLTRSPGGNLWRETVAEMARIVKYPLGPLAKTAKIITRRTGAIPAAIALAAVTVGTAYFLLHSANKPVDYLADSSAIKTPQQQRTAQNQILDLAQRVGKLVSLPPNEVPAVASITDVNKLAGQVFFAKAKDGDKVLIYSQAKKAFLYRPSTNQVINVANVDDGGQAGSGASSQAGATGGTTGNTLLTPSKTGH
jgi:hypothetical protein